MPMSCLSDAFIICIGFSRAINTELIAMINNTVGSISRFMHIFAAVLLFVFALSHFVLLKVGGDISLDGLNPVFPFLTNHTLYTLVAVFETMIAVFCLGYYKNACASWVILFFVALMLWYRWAFHLTGGTRCGCLGMLGKIFGLSKERENQLSLLALCLMLLAASPYLSQCVLRRWRLRFLGVGILGVMMLTSSMANANQAILISGEYETWHCNPKTKQVVTNTILHTAFTVELSGNTWSIYASNLCENGMWENLVYDGTNLYTKASYSANFANDKLSDGTSTSNYAFIAVSPSPVLAPAISLKTAIYIPWMTYCLSRESSGYASDKPLEIPLPWRMARSSPLSFGYKWVVDWGNDGNFLHTCNITRDVNLDLKTEKEEFLRKEIDYPNCVDEFNRMRSSLFSRKSVLNGWVAGRYRCTDTCLTNGLSVPTSSEFKYYIWNNQKDRAETPSFEGRLKATKVTVQMCEGAILPVVDSPAVVNDYRFRKDGKKRIHRFAEYVVQKNQPLRSDQDSQLLLEAQNAMKYGDKYDSFYTNRHYAVWTVFVLGLALPGLYFFQKQK
jgi:hypothetical protein